MTEVAFAKNFLSALDSKPQKLSPDHAEDPRGYPSRTPYILPKMPRAMSKRAPALAPGQERSLTVTIKSLTRNPAVDERLGSQPANTSVLDLKQAVAARTGLAADRMRLLLNKKPVLDSKVLKELVGEGGVAVDFQLMVLGGAAAAAAAAPKPAEVPAAGGDGAPLETEEFWADLKGFLLQRLKDEKEAEELYGTFRAAWSAKK